MAPFKAPEEICLCGDDLPESDDTKLQLLSHIQLSYGGQFYIKSVKSLEPEVVNSFAGVGRPMYHHRCHVKILLENNLDLKRENFSICQLYLSPSPFSSARSSDNS